jgi:PAS domain S-box-containing protein
MAAAEPFPITQYVVFDRIPVAALVMELDGRVVAANSAAARVFGRPKPELVDQPLGTILIADAGLERMLDSSRHGGEVVHELHFEGAAGLRTVECVMSVIQTPDRPMFQLFAIDVTCRKHAEAAARARADREAVAAAAQRFDSFGIVAGGVAHDFNSLLVGVLAESSAARENPALADGTRDALRRIEAAAERMAHLTRQMLAYAGRGRLEAQRLAPDELLAEHAASLVKLVRSGVQITVTPSARGTVIEADAGLLRQVFSNLVVNASEAGSTHVSVTSRPVTIDGQPQWQLDVTDDGIGMTAAVLARIFEPFFSTSPERHGLGLSAVQGIVRRLGGQLEVDSKQGQGARFTVRLPVIAGATAARVRHEAVSSPTAKLAGLRVLVADDEPSVRSTVRRLLERRGATVVLAANGVEAEERLRDERFDLVITDVVMPGRGGYDVLATARAVDPRCPVLVMSGYTDRARGEGGDQEPDRFLEKPFTARVLDAAIDDVMAARKAT